MIRRDLPPLPPHIEIANLEHELAVLRDRATILENDDRRISYISLVAVVIAILLFIFALHAGAIDLLQGSFIALLVAGVSAVALYVGRQNGPLDNYLIERKIWNHRWCYVAPSQAKFVEQAIIAREQRLAELRAQS